MSTASEKTEQHIRGLKQKRRYFKAQITNMSNYLEKYQDSTKERIKLRERIERLRTQFTKFNELTDELGLLGNFDEVESEREEVTDHYDDVIASAIELQESFSNTRGLEKSRDSPAPSVSSSLPVNLPKITLPMFDGRIETWVTFKDAFMTMIHSHSGLNNIQKFNYLRSSLSGRAETAIGAFTISEDNYEAAWNHLIDIYDNKRALVLRHAALLRDTPMMPDDSSESIRDLANYMQLHVRSLQALGRSWENIANDILASIVISRMSRETRKTWERTLSDTQVPKISDIFKYLHNASHQCKDYDSVAYATRSLNCKSETYKNQGPLAKPNRNRNSPPSSPRLKRRQTYATTVNPQSRRTQPTKTQPTKTQPAKSQSSTCKICGNGQHAAYQCKWFLELTIEKRIEAARKANLCLNCLRDDHGTEECKAGKCRVCNKLHNTRLHQETSSRQDNF